MSDSGRADAVLNLPDTFLNNGATDADKTNLVHIANAPTAFDSPHAAVSRSVDQAHVEIGGFFAVQVQGNFPAGFAGPTYSQVGVQGVVDADGNQNAWSWGGACIVQGDQDYSGGGGLWGLEADINNNGVHAAYGINNAEQNTKALAVVSGGLKRPQTGVQVLNSHAGAGFVYGLRFQQTGGLAAIDATGVAVVLEAANAVDKLIETRLISGAALAANPMFGVDAQGTHRWGPPTGLGAYDTTLRREAAGQLRCDQIVHTPQALVGNCDAGGVYVGYDGAAFAPAIMWNSSDAVIKWIAASKLRCNAGLGLYNVTPPAAQPSAVGAAAGFHAGATAVAFHSDDTYDGGGGGTAYTINGVVAALKALGHLAP